MQRQLPILVGLGAGVAAIALFAALLTVTPIALALFLVAPLPIAIAGLAFGPISAAVAAITVGVGIALAADPMIGLGALLIFAGPMAWLTHALNLSRQVDSDGRREWFPIGDAFLQMTALVAVGVILFGIAVGFDPVAVTREALDAVGEWADEMGGSGLTRDQAEPIVTLYIRLLPYTTPAFAVAILAFNGWLAGRIAEASGRLHRPRPPLWTAAIPAWTVVPLVAGMLVALAPGSIGLAGAVVAGTFGAAFVLVGLATLHAITLGQQSRGLILVIAYLLMLVAGISLAGLIVLGMADAVFRLRARFLPPRSGNT